MGRRLGGLEVHEQPCVHVGMEARQATNCSIQLTPDNIANALKGIPTTPALWAPRRRFRSLEAYRARRSKSGELPWMAAASRPDICALPAQVAARTNFLQDSGIYRTADLVKTALGQQEATLLKFASSPHAN